jgi:hypothetical protein
MVSEQVILANTSCGDMASEDDKQEDKEFEDIPSEVGGDASEVGNSLAQEKFDKLNKAVKENNKQEGRQEERERRRKEEGGQQARKEEEKKEGRKE